MGSGLMKNFAKKDAVHLLEIAQSTLQARSHADLEAVIRKLQGLVPFDKSFAVNASIIKKSTQTTLAPEPKFTGWTYGVSTEWLKEYNRQNMVLIDPIAKELLRTFDFLIFYELMKRSPAILKNPVSRLAQDFKILNGFTYAVRSADNTNVSSLVFYFDNPAAKVDQRTMVITKYIVPFLAELYKKIIEPSAETEPAPLTKREKEVLRWMLEGKTSWEISIILALSERTVNFHVANILSKFNATNRTQAVAIALKHNLIEF
jgi:DNA-binding CsgD family transcriptional regulator